MTHFQYTFYTTDLGSDFHPSFNLLLWELTNRDTGKPVCTTPLLAQDGDLITMVVVSETANDAATANVDFAPLDGYPHSPFSPQDTAALKNGITADRQPGELFDFGSFPIVPSGGATEFKFTIRIEGNRGGRWISDPQMNVGPPPGVTTHR